MGAMTSWLSRALVASALLGPAVAAAQPQPAPAVSASTDAGTARLPVLTPTDRVALAPLLAQGPVAFVEFTDGEELPAVLLAVTVHAPAATIAHVIADPAGYPRFMASLDTVHVTSRTGQVVAYEWTWRAAMFELHGTNQMTAYAPPARNAAAGHRIAIRAVSGDLGTGRFLWRVIPQGPSSSLVTLSVRLDTRQGSYVARQLSAGARSINRSINIALALEMLLSSRREAEHRAAPPTAQRAPSPGPAATMTAAALHRPDFPMDALAPMLARGDLVVLHMQGDRLSQVTVMGRMGKSRDETRAIMTDPTAFGSALMPGSHVDAAGRDEQGALFDWTVSLPLIGSSGRMRLVAEPAQISLDALSGNLVPGHWRFETPEYSWGEAAVVGWGHFDPATASWLLRGVVEGDRDFGHGIEAASLLMVVRAIRSRLWPEQ